MKKFAFVILLLLSLRLHAIDMYGVYPTHWWTGMKDNKLQLMIHGEKVGLFTKLTTNYPGIKVVKIQKAENPNYLFVDISIAPGTKPGKFKFLLSGGAPGSEDFFYELKTRNKGNGKTRVKGVDSRDFIYLLMPDRFSNSDPSNDIIPGYRDEVSDRKNRFARHGGDFEGIRNHLGYLEQLGVTTLWLTPVIENDMPQVNEWGNNIAGYHGYWFTDHYSIDKRFGGNEGYKQLCDELHTKGMKIIQDAVYNHVGNHHWFALDPPMKSWFNTSQGDKGPNHREEVFYDPYASRFDKKQMLDGWFVPHLPDLNQTNHFVEKFLIQHAIWTTEEFGIDGWRVDTYKYCDEAFMNKVNNALLKEFPTLTIFGESWVNSTLANAYFTRNNIASPFKHNAEGMLDFQVAFAIMSAINEGQSWMGGVNKLYTTLSQDVLYKDPMNNCIFLDNHDMDRIYSVGGEDNDKLKMALNWLLTLRGIPQLYYGTEVLMKNKKENTDATVREDFPGGWPDDKPKENRFTKEGRSDKQEAMYNYVSALARFRKNSLALTLGRTKQYIPRDGLYTYFRYHPSQTVMVTTNTGDKKASPDWKQLAESITGFTRGKNVITGEIIVLSQLELKSKESLVLELLK